jgi:hypothetical protein
VSADRDGRAASERPATPTVPGLVLRVDGELRFVPAAIAVRIAPPPKVTPLPGAPPELVGVALHEGTVVPVVAIGLGRGSMLICVHDGELVGVVGGEVVRAGSFCVSADRPDVVDYEGRGVPALDIAAICARVQSSAGAGRWASSVL